MCSFVRPRLPERLQSSRARLWEMLAWCGKHLNFFRVHVLVFTFTPLLAACIFYAANTETHIKFIDSLFVCVSAMTVTGLASINISTANGGQQAIIFILMCIGNISAVSVTMVWIRRHFFRARFDHVIRTSAKARKKVHDVEVQEQRDKRLNRIKLQRMMGLHPVDSVDSSEEHADRTASTASSSSDHIEVQAQAQKKKQGKNGKRQPVRADMIRRIDGPAFLINSAGVASTAVPVPGDQARDQQQTDQHPWDGGRRSASDGDASAVARRTSGIILNNDSTNDESPAPQVVASQQPSIRISLPPSPTSASVQQGSGAPTFAESPVQDSPAFRKRSTSVPRRGSLPTFIEEPPRSGQELASEDEEALEMPKSAGPSRARFDESVDNNDSDGLRRGRPRRVSDPAQERFRRGLDPGPRNLNVLGRQDPFPRAQTVEFAEPHDLRFSRSDGTDYDRRAHTTGINPQLGMGLSSVRSRTGTRELDRTTTMRSHISQQSGRTRGAPLTRTTTSSKQRGFGGFPTPIEIAGMAFKKALPRVQDRLNRTMTMPRTSTFASMQSNGASAVAPDGGIKPAPYLSFDATVSGNSIFHELTEAQRDELGGVEYRAIDLLAKLLPAYWLIVNFFMIVLVAPYISSGSFPQKYREVFDSQGEYKPNRTWFWFFQVVSAYTNTGMSLIDTSMSGMQDAYFLLIPMALLILMGNTAFPIFLRLFIWCISKMVPSNSRLSETLQFLLDHPRRCFVYLFPSGQTWFLLFVLLVFNVTDWVAFLVLDIGNPVIESIPAATRVFDGLFQSIAVRAAGFQVVSLLTLAPAVQFLYVVMMYLSAFPLALSVRSTNVYEEKSLGIYTQEPTGPGAIPDQSDAKVWGTFVASHARKQLAFDIWWLGFALLLICIVERSNIEDANSNTWFTVFSCMFELTSAYGTVGLSTGTPYDSFSLSGRFSTLSKLIVICVMIRGRHRGLPVAIDRAVLLPSDVELEDEVVSQYPMDEQMEQERPEWTGLDPTSADNDATDVEADANLEPSASFSNIRHTTSVLSFAGPGRGARTGLGSEGLVPSSPKSPNSSQQSRHSLTLGGLGGSGAGSGAGSGSKAGPGLSAIHEMPGISTPGSGSRPTSPSPNPPSYTHETLGARPGSDTHDQIRVAHDAAAAAAEGSDSNVSGETTSSKGKETDRSSTSS